MRTVLVLTDFTKNADHAAATAIILAEKLHAKLLIYNTFYNMPILPSYTDSPWVVQDLILREEESNKKLIRIADSLRQKIVKSAAELYKPKVSCKYGEGELAGNVEALVKENDIALIVMGARTGSTLGHIFIGSDTRSVIDHASRPVMIIPAKAKFQTLQQVTFATNFEDADLKAVRYLLKISKAFHFKLQIVHVSLFGALKIDNDARKIAFQEQVSHMKFAGVSYKEVKGGDVINRLNRLCATQKSNLLVMTHYKDSTTKKALSYHKIPLLVIPSKMEDK
jgi:nucleotide-binding universal stress UspA family protein